MPLLKKALLSKIFHIKCITATRTLLDLFYPPHCVGCSCYLSGTSSLCESCWHIVKFLPETICSRCSFSLSSPKARCLNCHGRELHFVAGMSALRYEGLVKHLLHKLKYGKDQSLKKAMGELINLALTQNRFQNIAFTAVVPVPLFSLRQREREFNQAELIAQEVAKHLSRPLENLLKRVKETPFQARADRKKRIQHLQGAFALKKQQQLSGTYLLVDDVLTTGSTLNECAKTLRKAGAKEVWAITVARS